MLASADVTCPAQGAIVPLDYAPTSASNCRDEASWGKCMVSSDAFGTRDQRCRSSQSLHGRAVEVSTSVRGHVRTPITTITCKLDANGNVADVMFNSADKVISGCNDKNKMHGGKSVVLDFTDNFIVQVGANKAASMLGQMGWVVQVDSMSRATLASLVFECYRAASAGCQTQQPLLSKTDDQGCLHGGPTILAIASDSDNAYVQACHH